MSRFSYSYINFHRYADVDTTCEAIIENDDTIIDTVKSEADVRIVRASIPLTSMPLGGKRHYMNMLIGVVSNTKEFYENVGIYLADDYYSPQSVTNAMNDAMSVVAAAASPVIASGDTPKFSVSIANGISVTIPAAFTSAGYRIGGNIEAYTQLLCGWSAVSNPKSTDVLTYLLNSSAAGTQSFSTLGSLYKNKELVVVSHTVPINGEMSSNGGNYNLPVLTDFDISSVNPKQNVIIQPTVDRWVSLKRASPQSRLQVKIYVRDVFGNLSPLMMQTGLHFSLKLCLRVSENTQ